MRSISSRCARVLCGCLVLVACGGDDGDAEGTATTPGMTSVVPTTSGGDDTTDDSSADDDSSSSGVGESTADPDDATGSPETTGAPSSDCDPKMAPFLAPDGAPAQASIHLDFDTPSCAAASLSGEDPQIVLDVKPTGLIDATLFGLEIVSVSSGQPFDEPPVGDSVVIDLMPDLVITFEATRVGDGTPVTISFEIFSTGPTLLDVAVAFG